MSCYRHPARDATGICRVCGKALCYECANDLGFALSCSGSCKKQAKADNRIYENTSLYYRRLKTFRVLGPLFFLLFALIFMANSHSFTDTCFLTGSVFLIFSMALFIMQKKWSDRINT